MNRNHVHQMIHSVVNQCLTVKLSSKIRHLKVYSSERRVIFSVLKYNEDASKELRFISCQFHEIDKCF